MLYLKENGEIKRSQDPSTGERPKNWFVRVIPNLYPAFSPPKQPEDTAANCEERVFVAMR